MSCQASASRGTSRRGVRVRLRALTLTMLLWDRAGRRRRRRRADRDRRSPCGAGVRRMEAVSYLMHRFVMHGPGRPSTPTTTRRPRWFRAQRPLSGVVLGAGHRPVRAGHRGARAGAARGRRHRHDALRAVVLLRARGLRARPAAGAAARWAYSRWLERMHRIHHLYGGEPYGMLLPVVPRRCGRGPPWTSASRSPGASTRAMRSRL